MKKKYEVEEWILFYSFKLDRIDRIISIKFSLIQSKVIFTARSFQSLETKRSQSICFFHLSGPRYHLPELRGRDVDK